MPSPPASLPITERRVRCCEDRLTPRVILDLCFGRAQQLYGIVLTRDEIVISIQYTKLGVAPGVSLRFRWDYGYDRYDRYGQWEIGLPTSLNRRPGGQMALNVFMRIFVRCACPSRKLTPPLASLTHVVQHV